jgi:hypothetical protein
MYVWAMPVGQAVTASSFNARCPLAGLVTWFS